ncbi:cupin domain-containing protein [Lentzea sp. NPDC051213]|uniref:cupin domain-containing protein n=1 Tax=Lentzea sp. NPDC051213 TaxID=3364126 RepID=UPI003792BCE6
MTTTLEQGPTVGTTAQSAEVHGVHGAAGVTRWTCFAGRRQLQSPSEAVEWASIPPGGMSGEHLHSRTEEIYLILTGSGEFLLNGEAHPVEPGTLALTGVGNVHGLRNTGTTDLDWLVIETLAPPTRSVLAGQRPTHGGAPVSKAVLFDLFADKHVDTTGVFSGPLKRVEVVDVQAGTATTLGQLTAELAIYVYAGTGTTSTGVQVSPGTCVLLPSATTTDFTATNDLRLLVTTLSVTP